MPEVTTWGLAMGKLKEVPTAWMPKFRGYIGNPSNDKGFAFVDSGSIVQIAGREYELPHGMDLLLHVSENRDLGDPTMGDAWITFFVQATARTKSKVLVFGAKYDS